MSDDKVVSLGDKKKAISDDLTNKMKSALETFKKQFTA